MKKQLLHTPDGVRDIYNGECRQKIAVQERLRAVQLSYGYHDIQTPSFEFFSIFSQEIGTTPSKDLYKFFDKEGNTLVLRPDFTPSIARSAAKYYTEADMPVKLCYMGNTFINSSDYQGRLKETTQCGVELIGDSSVAADAEILSMVVESLKAVGLREFQISVGHARFFQGLIEAAGLKEEEEEELRILISNKNFLGVEEFIKPLQLEKNLKKLFLLLGSFDASAEDLVDAKEYAKEYATISSAIVELETLYDFLKIYGIDKYISFELGMVSSYHYYTGIIFSGYTFGTGQPVVKGGRYDKLLTYFGKNAPSIGFAIVVDQLLSALSRQRIFLPVKEESVLIVFTEDTKAGGIARAKTLRENGKTVETLLMDSLKSREDYEVYAKKYHMESVEFLES